MDAERLISLSRNDLAESRAVPDIMASAWQAQCLAQAIGDHLALLGPRELRGEARGLGEIGGRGGATPGHPVPRTGAAASRLSEVLDPRGTLTALGALLGEVGMALVGVACTTDEEGLYWQCVEAIDAADEAGDRVRAMLRRMAVHDRTRPPDRPDGERDRGGAAPGGAPEARPAGAGGGRGQANPGVPR
ncbi:MULTISPECIES: DUF6099 family protein [Streptomyces]|uniref:DUF6099 family protein n=1 Tax=Streptomyces sudanensis TaxID=436397 RepID=A0ABY4TEH5_9ACTN|nr:MULTISPECIES: DUF6099 family protein [Streptomyces]MCP9956824.1 DUF6099 family protein [Streptomyces sudanensis]MCP9986022.1 DUF6099 family protein [Streptomyces sudanensis]URN17346.1 DUF6099 family protein [Streptomyces sudanensis]